MIPPKEEELLNLNSSKLLFSITDYAELGRNLDKTIAILNKNGFAYRVHPPEHWTDSGKILERNNDVNTAEAQKISNLVRSQLLKAARILNIEGYARIDAFVRIFSPAHVEVIFIEVNSLPGMTPATCIFHQTAINGYKPFDFIDRILDFGFKRKALIAAAKTTA